MHAQQTLLEPQSWKQRRDEWINSSEELAEILSGKSLGQHACSDLQGADLLPVLNPGKKHLQDSERQRIEWTQHRREFPVTESLPEWFQRIARLHPEAIALSMGDRRLTYAELDEFSNSLAHRLIVAGVKLESRVGICVERSLEMVIGILGILKAGGAYVPLDPNYPNDRLEYMIRDAEIRVMVCEDHRASGFSQFKGQLTTVTPTDHSAVTNCGAPDICIPPDAAAYVIYTSGSTGLPKGCVLTHANVARLFLCCESLYSFNSNDVWTLFHSISFDFSIWEIWGSLLYGGRLVVVPYSMSHSPKQFWNLLLEERVTILNQTPSAFRQLIQAETEDSIDRVCLRYVIFGGEPLDPRALRAWFRRHGDSKPELINMYGITETTVHVTYHKLTIHDAEIGGHPIGVPLPDLSIHLLDEEGQPVPIGVDGEIYVSGPGLARGYLNRAELTAARFVEAKFPECQPGLLYRSGDLARWNEDGSLDFRGRIDTQVKVRGHRVELGEIEVAVGEFPGVSTCAVIAREMADDDTRLICYIVADTNSTFRHGELDQHLRRSLPVYMIPSAFVQIPFLPLTINGKLDKKALPDPASTRPDLLTPYVAPRNEVEEAIANIWKEVLGMDQVGIHDNFLELGGHSLLAARIVQEVSDRFPHKFRDVDLFSHLTIAQLTSGDSDPSKRDVAEQQKYLEAIRVRGDATHLLMVGPTLRAPLDRLPSDVSVWLLKKDGFHTWPSLNLDVLSEAIAYAKEIRRAIPSGKLIICGHSYSGLLALETANQLIQNSDAYEIELLLFEAFEAPLSNRIEQLRKMGGRSLFQKTQLLLNCAKNRLSSVVSRLWLNLKQLMSKGQQFPVSFANRTTLLLPKLRRNSRRYTIPIPDVNYHIFGREAELKATATSINLFPNDKTKIYELNGQLSHNDICMPEFNDAWASVVKKLCSSY